MLLPAGLGGRKGLRRRSLAGSRMLQRKQITSAIGQSALSRKGGRGAVAVRCRGRRHDPCRAPCRMAAPARFRGPALRGVLIFLGPIQNHLGLARFLPGTLDVLH